MTINQSFQNWTVITDEPGEELVFEHEDPETGQKDRFVLTEEAGLGSKMDPVQVYPDNIANAHFAYTSDDLQTVIDGASAGDTVIIEAAQRTESNYPITIDKPLKLMGQSFTMGRADLKNYDGASFLVEENSAVIDIQADRQAVHLSDFGVEYADANSPPTAAIVGDAVSDGATNKEIGLQHAEWSNIGVVNHDDAYAYQLVNPQHNILTNIKFADGGGIEFVNDHASINCGNTTVIELFGELPDVSVHGIHHRAISSRMNLNQFYRPQVNVNQTISNGGQHVEFTEAGGNVAKNFYVGANFESFDDSSGGANYANGTKIYPVIHSAPFSGNARFFDGQDLNGEVIIDDNDIDCRILNASGRVEVDSTGDPEYRFIRGGDHLSTISAGAGALKLEDEDGTRRIDVLSNGTKIAELDSDGNLSIAGTVNESTTF